MPNKRFKHKKPQRDTYLPPYSEEILSESLDGLSLREETLNLLVNASVNTLREVLKREEKDFYRISTFNKKNLIDLKKALQVRKLELKPTTEKPQEEGAEKPQASKTLNANTVGNTKIVGNANAVGNTKNVGNVNATGNKKNAGNANVATNGNPNKNQPKAKNIVVGERNLDQTKKNVAKDKYGVVESATFASIVPEKPPRVTVVPEKDIPDIYMKVNKGGKWGFRDRAGKQVVAPIYDEVFNYKEDICCVERDELFGYINREGEEIVPLVYSCATSFSEGLACVFKKDKCGYINAQNEIIIDLKYDAGTPVIEGGCRVKLDGKWGELHIDNPLEVRWIN